MPAMTRGPLPPSVYWRRRLVVLTVALLLLWSVIHLLGGHSSSTPRATPAADLTGASASASPSASPSGSTGSSSPSDGAADGAAAGAATAPAPAASVTPTPTPTPTVLPSPSGPCPPSDLSVTPSVTGATAGANVPIVLTLQTFTTPACTWQVSHKTMQVKVSTAGGRDVWSTIDCPAALPAHSVVVYKDQPTPITLTWSGRESDQDCSAHTAWVNAGSYSVTGVALGGVPDQASFVLAPPVATPPAPPASSTPAATSPSASATPSGSAAATPQVKHHKKKHPAAD